MKSILAATMILACNLAGARTWTDVRGKTIEGDLIAISGYNIDPRSEATVAIGCKSAPTEKPRFCPISRLSNDDLIWLYREMHRQYLMGAYIIRRPNDFTRLLLLKFDGEKKRPWSFSDLEAFDTDTFGFFRSIERYAAKNRKTVHVMIDQCRSTIDDDLKAEDEKLKAEDEKSKNDAAQKAERPRYEALASLCGFKLNTCAKDYQLEKKSDGRHEIKYYKHLDKDFLGFEHCHVYATPKSHTIFRIELEPNEGNLGGDTETVAGILCKRYKGSSSKLGFSKSKKGSAWQWILTSALNNDTRQLSYGVYLDDELGNHAHIDLESSSAEAMRKKEEDELVKDNIKANADAANIL